jgi:hypothetical protein
MQKDFPEYDNLITDLTLLEGRQEQNNQTKEEIDENIREENAGQPPEKRRQRIPISDQGRPEVKETDHGQDTIQREEARSARVKGPRAQRKER